MGPRGFIIVKGAIGLIWTEFQAKPTIVDPFWILFSFLFHFWGPFRTEGTLWDQEGRDPWDPGQIPLGSKGLLLVQAWQGGWRAAGGGRWAPGRELSWTP